MRTAKSNTATVTIVVRRAIKRSKHVSPAAVGEAVLFQRAVGTVKKISIQSTCSIWNVLI